MSRYAEDQVDQFSRFLMLDTTTTTSPPQSCQAMSRQTFSPETYCSSLSSSNSSLSSSPTTTATLYANPPPRQRPCSANPETTAMSEYSLPRNNYHYYHPNTSSPSSRRTSAFSPSTLAISPIPEHGALDIPYDVSTAASSSSSWSRRTSSSTECYEENVNYDIKMHLTDLLNCETVRQDSRMRLWVQARLMEAELELKRQRRRSRGSSGRVASLPAVVVVGAAGTAEDVERRCSS